MLELPTKQKPFSLHILHNDTFTRANRFRSIFFVKTINDILLDTMFLHFCDIIKIFRVNGSNCEPL